MHVRDKADEFQTLSDLRIGVDASAFYPSIQEFYDSGELPFYRVGDVDEMVEVERATKISAELCNKFPTLKRVRRGDILFTKGGAIDRTGYVIEEGAVSRDLIFLKTSHLPESKRLLMFTYFRTAFFRRMLLRSSSQTAQPHLTIKLVRELPIFLASDRLSDAVASAVVDAYHHADQAANLLRRAEDTLLEALGLADWEPQEPLSYTARASDAFAAGRLDAQYFSSKFDELLERLLASGARLKTIRDIRFHNARGLQPEYIPEGDVHVVNSRHILEARIDYEGLERTTTEWLKTNERARLQSGDILTYTTGAKIGRTAHFALASPAAASNHVNILRLSEGNPEYVAFVMNSLVGRLQTERHLSGTAQPELYPGDIDKFFVPFIPEGVESSVTARLRESEESRSQARQLLEAAKRAVEIAIENGEAAAMAFLDQAEGVN